MWDVIILCSGEDGRKKKKRMTSSKVDGLSDSGNECTVGSLKDQVRDRLSWRKFMCSVRIDINSMTDNQMRSAKLHMSRIGRRSDLRYLQYSSNVA